MSKKTLIINGSPRPHGNTACLIDELKKHLDGEVIELSAYRSNIHPCIDCRKCEADARCAVKDDMQIIYNDDFDNVVLASPVYFATLPGPVLSLISRFQHQHVALDVWKKPLKLREKKAGVILTAGGRKNAAKAEPHIFILFRMMNAKGFETHFVHSLETDTLASSEDLNAIDAVKELAQWLNEKTDPICP